MRTATFNFRIDENLKKQAESIFDDMGMNMTTAFTIFTKAVVRSGKIPFEIAVDPFWKTEYQDYLARQYTEYKAGGVELVVKTIEELEAMEND
ncbi:MAG: type II toxin-antitoxin system RelB/DinJ family antitoxin [Defluviitaleaceae bacterium]|nr:type II toxin-antitoxin system RelB/DinJ family antitoxin [Defluviitaleaceae bacterium]